MASISHSSYFRKAKSRRLNNYWEAHFDPDAGDQILGSWKIVPRQCIVNSFFDFGNIHNELKLNERATATYSKNIFCACDFEGEVGTRERVVFKNCRFIECDFEKSFLRNFKFTSCTFERCSFTLCDMSLSELRDCKFFDISVSGNETILYECYLTNPEEFISAAYFSEEIPKGTVLRPSEKFKLYKGTKATVARGVLFSLKKHGSEGEYYKAVKAHEVAQGASRVAFALYEEKFLLALFCFLQYNMIKFMGYTNSWGKSPVRPVLFGFLVFSIYGFLYYSIGMEPTLFGSVEKSFNVTIVAGYNFAVSDVKLGAHRLIIATQLVLSLILYTSFFSTLIGRLSRVK